MPDRPPPSSACSPQHPHTRQLKPQYSPGSPHTQPPHVPASSSPNIPQTPLTQPPPAQAPVSPRLPWESGGCWGLSWRGNVGVWVYSGGHWGLSWRVHVGVGSGLSWRVHVGVGSDPTPDPTYTCQLQVSPPKQDNL